MVQEAAGSEPVRLDARAPGVMWLPARPAGAPLVLLGHGGSGDKLSARNCRLATRFTAAGAAVLAIDGPHHGDRAEAGDAHGYQRRMASRGMPEVIDEMTTDWMTAIETAADRHGVRNDRLGYLGMSMGARFGIPLCASLGSRLAAAVIGKFGVEECSTAPVGLSTPQLHLDAAERVEAPVFFHLQWDDEIFPRAGSLALFNVLGGGAGERARDETVLVGRPGRHRDQHPDDEPEWLAFIVRRL